MDLSLFDHLGSSSANTDVGATSSSLKRPSGIQSNTDGKKSRVNLEGIEDRLAGTVVEKVQYYEIFYSDWVFYTDMIWL